MKKFIKIIRLFILLLLITLLLVSFFIKSKFELLSFDQLLFYSTTSLEGTSSSFFINCFKNVIIYLIISYILCLILIYYIKNYELVIKFRNRNNHNIFEVIYDKRIVIDIILSIIIFCVSLYNVKFFEYIKLSFDYTDIYEKEFVNPRKVDIDFDGKRNLIMIYVESLESTDFSKENGGYRDYSLIPNLEKIYKDNIGLNNNYYSLVGDSWTIAGMFTSLAGIPYKAEFLNDFAKLYDGDFMPGAYTLSDFFKDNNYNQVFIMGSDDEFGSRDIYLKEHGDYNIIDYDVIKDEYEYDDNDLNDWGFNDRYIFNIAKKQLLELSKDDKSFNLSLLTADTHPIEGYFDNSVCKYNDKYSSLENAYSCEDIMINNFVNWIKKQDFYKDTTIVIVGDHLAMYRDAMGEIIPDKSDRSLYSVFINSKINYNCNSNYSWMTEDLYPTILASMGAKIEGDRLGLGTNIFSCKETIYDKYSESLYDELSKKSKLYDKCIMDNKCD